MTVQRCHLKTKKNYQKIRFKQDREVELEYILFSSSEAAFICVDDIQRFTQAVWVFKNSHLFRVVPLNKAPLCRMQKMIFRLIESNRAKIRSPRPTSRKLHSERQTPVDS